MDRDGVSEGDLVQLAGVIEDIASVEPHGDLALHGVDLDDLSDVAVEHILVVIVRLDHVVPWHHFYNLRLT